MAKIESEEPSAYQARPEMPYFCVGEDAIIRQALAILRKRLKPGAELSNPADVRKYLELSLSAAEAESFGAVWLTNQNTVIKRGHLFNGTINEAAVYPREVVKAALRCNAGAVIFYHNHPSGLAEPSPADIILTNKLKEAMDLVGVKVLDHFVIGGGESVSFAERGLL